MLDVNLERINIISDKSTFHLLENINFLLENNNIYTIVGKNGSGKTSLILALTQLLNNSSHEYTGSVSFNNKELLTLDEKELQVIRERKIKYVFQDPISSFDQLKKISYYFSNIVFDKSELDTLLNYFQLPVFKEIKNKYPYELSTGMAQRISIILAMLSNPELLILDEPTSALDMPIINLLLHKLKSYVQEKNRIVLIVTQDISFALEVSDKIAFLSNKHLTEFAKPDEFISNTSNQNLMNFIGTYNQLNK